MRECITDKLYQLISAILPSTETTQGNVQENKADAKRLLPGYFLSLLLSVQKTFHSEAQSPGYSISLKSHANLEQFAFSLTLTTLFIFSIIYHKVILQENLIIWKDCARGGNFAPASQKASLKYVMLEIVGQSEYYLAHLFFADFHT